MKGCHEIQRGRCVGDMHGFTLPTAAVAHLLRARRPAGPRDAEVGMTSPGPLGAQELGLETNVPTAVERHATCLWERRGPTDQLLGCLALARSLGKLPTMLETLPPLEVLWESSTASAACLQPHC